MGVTHPVSCGSGSHGFMNKLESEMRLRLYRKDGRVGEVYSRRRRIAFGDLIFLSLSFSVIIFSV